MYTSSVSRARVQEAMDEAMQGLSLAEPGAATARKCGPDRRNSCARRMVRELEHLREHYATGNGVFDPIRHTEERVTLKWDRENDLHVLDVQVCSHFFSGMYTFLKG